MSASVTSTIRPRPSRPRADRPTTAAEPVGERAQARHRHGLPAASAGVMPAIGQLDADDARIGRSA
jgi:hypothetical protein